MKDKKRKIVTIISIAILIVIFLLWKTCGNRKSFVVDNIKSLYFGHYKEEKIEVSAKNKSKKYYFEVSADKNVKYDIKIFSNKLNNTIVNKNIKFKLIRNNEYIYWSKDEYVSLDSLGGFSSLELIGEDIFVKAEEVKKSQKNKYSLEVIYSGELKNGNYLLNLDFIIHGKDQDPSSEDGPSSSMDEQSSSDYTSNIDKTSSSTPYKREYSITFESEGIVLDKIILLNGSKVTYKKVPTKTGYKFLGWSELGYTTMPNQDLETVGSFSPNRYDAVFKINNETCGTSNVLFGEQIIIPSACATEEEGYVYSEWLPEVGIMDEEGKTFTRTKATSDNVKYTVKHYIENIEDDGYGLLFLETLFGETNSNTNFTAPGLKTMYNTFNGCTSLTSLDLSSFHTPELFSMLNTFFGCNRLVTLNLSSFDTSKVSNMGYLFYNNTRLTNVDFRNADFSKVTSYASMFSNIKMEAEILVKDQAAYDFIKARSSRPNPVIYNPNP